MNCAEIYRQKNYSLSILNQAFNDDSGSWWWWTNIIGILTFGLIGLSGNLICFLVICRFSLFQHSFVEYLRALAFFDFFALFYECLQSLNDLFIYLFSKNFLNFRFSFICKFYDYTKHSIILLSCWTIVGLTIDRLILVCNPWSKKWPNLSRRLCNRYCAKCIILIFVFFSLLINLPQLIYKEWICRPTGFQYSAMFHNLNQTKNIQYKQICSCRVSPLLNSNKMKFFIFWNNYIFHLLFYTLIPAIILIGSNAAILKRLHAPRQIISQQNEHIRSKLTITLTLVSLIFLILYFPYAIVQTLSYFIIRYYQSHCNISLILSLHKLKRLSELLNIAALCINFFIYILGVNHYRSSTIKMLGLHHFEIFQKYLIIDQQKNLDTTNKFIEKQNSKIFTQTDSSNTKLLKVTSSSHGVYSTSSIYNNRLSKEF
ncbi:unnamed protein product [Rotaria sordida]|uniref:G-protein coupled receptors family 1 profile domain-containing protein n=1 Tax=Rotaria sordida TaxID=392033 RepID=A0A814K3I9_9BILA|nr:unnamed protein product [Rotaria sordida]CAF1058388.1 unnamed protein product [Rotaria sordida]CAF1343387.1 unnamed protein product [Rotaria sordida]CAF3958757.1 unnamed protein product [Rotaria sordida]CAF4162441.1 unnamed protein product [Rotaria sordida]